MNCGYQKYLPFSQANNEHREWPEHKIVSAPIWCSTDLRDGNQALPRPMSINEKLQFFALLCKIGFKQIEVGYPSASEIEFNFVRKLIEENLIPDDVTIQVITLARDDLIERTFSAISGAKNVIINFYNSTSKLYRETVFESDAESVAQTAVNAAKLIYSFGQDMIKAGTHLTYEYIPESFSGTETELAADICAQVMEALHVDQNNKIILTLPATVELGMPNQYADQIELFCRLLPNRDHAIISAHTHNDRGTGIAATEMALLAGAERVEGTLFGNGERTGNADLVTLAFNLYTQGIDPELNLFEIDKIRALYESFTNIPVHPRHPYVGDLVYTAFSGNHQNAIEKGIHYLEAHQLPYWQVPYLPMDPADIGRSLETIIRINSQSGKAGAAFVLEQVYGYRLPKAMHNEFGALVQAETERYQDELPASELLRLFTKEYVNRDAPYRMLSHAFSEFTDSDGQSRVTFTGTLSHNETQFSVSGEGNGPIDAFFNAIHGQKMDRFSFVDYSEHAISDGSDSRAVAYIHLRSSAGEDFFGVGISHNIYLAPLRGIISAINRACIKK